MKNLLSFRNLGLIIYSLLGLIPYMLAAFLVVHFKTELPITVLLIAAAVLVSHLFGLTIINRFGRQLEKVDHECALASTSSEKRPIVLPADVPKELADLVNHFNVMVNDVISHDRKYREMTTQLLLYTQDIERYEKKLMNEALLRQHLSRYVSSGIVESLMRADGNNLLQDRRAEVTILFADIRSFTAMAESLPPESVVAILNGYFEAMTAVVFAYDGILDKFVGDELMAVFGLAGSEDYGATAAVNAALAMQKTMQMLIADFRKRALPDFEVGIGINTGEVLVANVGSKNRKDYTVIGDVVNVASRLEQKAQGGTIVIGEGTYRHCRVQTEIVQQGDVQVRNREKTVKFYEITEQKVRDES